MGGNLVAQGRHDGAPADGDRGGLPLLPLDQDHCQLLRGCPSNFEATMMMMMIVDNIVSPLVTSQCRDAGPRLLTNFASFPNSLPSSPDATSQQLTHRAFGVLKGDIII